MDQRKVRPFLTLYLDTHLVVVVIVLLLGLDLLLGGRDDPGHLGVHPLVVDHRLHNIALETVNSY